MNQLRFISDAAESSQQKAALFNNYFCSVFLNSSSDEAGEPANLFSNSSLSQLTVESDQILKHLQSLDVSKAKGSDNIPGAIFRNWAFQLTPPITYLLNRSPTEGKFPTSFKLANITPVHKKGDPTKQCWKWSTCVSSTHFQRFLW